MLYLILSTFGSNEHIYGDEKDNDSNASKNGHTHCEPQKDDCHGYLKRSKPQDVDVYQVIHKPFGIDRHEVDNLSRSVSATDDVVQAQDLTVHSEDMRTKYH